MCIFSMFIIFLSLVGEYYTRFNIKITLKLFFKKKLYSYSKLVYFIKKTLTRSSFTGIKSLKIKGYKRKFTQINILLQFLLGVNSY